jgi:hypothetical protein
MTFKFQIIESMETFKDPIGHYHHWSVLAGRLIEGTIHLGDPICIPAVDGTKMCARVGGFDRDYPRAERKPFGSQVACGQHADPLSVMVWSPAPSRRQVAAGVATGISHNEFHELVGWALRHGPARLLHDRGPEGLGRPCGDCTSVLYSQGSVLHADFEQALRELCRHPDPYIAGRAHDIISKAMSEEEYKTWRELQEAAGRERSRRKFWKR